MRVISRLQKPGQSSVQINIQISLSGRNLHLAENSDMHPFSIGISDTVHSQEMRVYDIPQNIPFAESQKAAMANVVALRAKETSAPDNVLRKVPCRPKNRDVRSREHLLPKEVESLMKSTGKVGRHGLRDRTLILVAYRDGLRVSELVGLKSDQVEFRRALLHVNRLKSGLSATHPIGRDELRLLRRLKREYPDVPFVFTT
jgi:integrase